MDKIAVILPTMQSHLHVTDDIERGVKVYERGGIELSERGPGHYVAQVPHKGDFKVAAVTFTQDGQDIESCFCSCTASNHGTAICRHIVAAVLAVQGGVIPTRLALGMTARVTAKVTEENTAKAVGSGDLNVFATPAMIALMESAACKCLAGALDDGQTSVGTSVHVDHTTASPLGANITATATIEYIFGRKIEFVVTASSGRRKIGKGRHTRLIVDAERFLAKTAAG